MELADKQSPRYWQLAKALQRSLNAYDERNPESVEAARWRSPAYWPNQPTPRP